MTSSLYDLIIKSMVSKKLKKAQNLTNQVKILDKPEV